MKLLTTTVLWLVLYVLCPNPPSLNAQSVQTPHFRWSEQLAHELDYNHTVATAKELTAQERHELLAFFVQRFTNQVSERDEMLEGVSDADIRKFAGNMRIERLDLNGDGIDEIIAQGNDLGLCGGTGNCIVMVLQKVPAGWKPLFDSYRLGNKLSGGFEKIRVMSTSNNGFREIVLASHVSASERTLEVFRFANGQYRRSDCYYYSVSWGKKYPEISHGCGD